MFNSRIMTTRSKCWIDSQSDYRFDCINAFSLDAISSFYQTNGELGLHDEFWPAELMSQCPNTAVLSCIIDAMIATQLGSQTMIFRSTKPMCIYSSKLGVMELVSASSEYSEWLASTHNGTDVTSDQLGFWVWRIFVVPSMDGTHYPALIKYAGQSVNSKLDLTLQVSVTGFMPEVHDE